MTLDRFVGCITCGQQLLDEQIFFNMQSWTLEKKARGQLTPKFLDLVASTNFLVAKKILALRAKTLYFKSFAVKDEKPYEKRNPLMLYALFHYFSWTSYKKIYLVQEENVLIVLVRRYVWRLHAQCDVCNYFNLQPVGIGRVQNDM